MCGVCGVFNHPEAAFLAYLMTFKHQHRGQEAAGIAVINGSGINVKKGLGLVEEVFDKGKYFSENADFLLKGRAAIGHVRYSTFGVHSVVNAQPFSPGSIESETSRGDDIAISYNGNLANAEILKEELEAQGIVFRSSTDTEVILKFLTINPELPLEERIMEFSRKAEGSYSIAILEKRKGIERLVAVRDPHGFMPLVLGSVNDSFLVASETRAFDVLRSLYKSVSYLREILPGEIVSISEEGLRSSFIPPKEMAACVFQYVYFTMPSSIVFGLQSGIVKKQLGRQLAREDADFIRMANENFIVIPIPDSANLGALGYSQESGLPFEIGIERDHYIGRNFIQPEQFTRDLGTALKFNPIEGIIRGKRIVLVDDSIVRATTITRVISSCRRAGAEEVHVRIFSPPYQNPCFYGIDTPSWNELAAASMSVEQIREASGADSLRYLSIEGLKQATAGNANGYCMACFSGEYPTKIFTSRMQQEREAVLMK